MLRGGGIFAWAWLVLALAAYLAQFTELAGPLMRMVSP